MKLKQAFFVALNRAEALGRHIEAKGITPQLVVVSPLTRALQPASGVLAFFSDTQLVRK